MMANPMCPRLRLGVALAATAVLLGGCSALQIDVDVYKGPLASQREVQLRQFSALAIAARPLLAELRNEAEMRDHEKKESFRRAVSGPQLERHTNYSFQDELARFANGVLSFYEDQGPETLAPQTDAVQDEYVRFAGALVSFEVARSDCLLARDLESMEVDPTLRDLKAKYLNFLRAGSISDPADASSRCAPGGRKSESVYTSSAAAGRRRVEEVRAAWNTACALRPVGSCQAMRDSVSESYRQLAGGLVANQQSKALYPDAADSDKAQRLAARVQAIGTSFGNARDAMKRLAVSSVRLLEETGAQEKDRTGPASLVAGLLANVIEPRVFACAVERMYVPGLDPDFRERLLNELPRDWSSLQRGGAARGEMYARANDALRRIASEQPVQVARAVRLIHSRLQTRTPEEEVLLLGCSPFSFDTDGQPPNRRAVEIRKAELDYATAQFGLARGTAGDNELDAALHVAVADIRSVPLANSFGFDSGRTRFGLVTLTRNYQNAVSRAQDDPANRRDVEETRRQLEEQLLAFAERMLYVANNYEMIERSGRKDAYQPVGDDADFAQRAAILQAVGNNIIVQIDDIRRQADHDRALVSRRESEAIAINRAFAGNASRTFDAMLQDVKATATKDIGEGNRLAAVVTSARRLTDSMDQEIERLTGIVAEKQRGVTKAGEELTTHVQALQPVRNAALTLLANPGAVPSSGIPDDATAVADRAKIPAEVAKTLGAKSNGEQYRAAVQTWIAGEMEKEAADSKRFKRLEVAKGYIEKNAALFAGIAEQATNLTLTAFRNIIASEQRKLDEPAVVAKRKLDALNRDLTADQKSLKVRTDARAQAGTTTTSTNNAISANTSALGDVNAILEAIREVRGEVLNKADEGGADAKSLITALLSALKAKGDNFKPEPPETRNKYKLAADYVAKITPPTTLTVSQSRGGRSARSAITGERTQVDVLDDLIAQLRQQRLNALASGQKDRAANLDAALEAAYEQRAGMAYLRPTSAYLRNVYAATSVQSDPDVGWVNLLWRNATRGLSFENKKQAARVNVEKQFWQNINTVQLGGAGSANYAVVKDDVGNWYVKAYGADTSSIIQSAQSLALFNLGRKFDVNLLKQSELRQQLAGNDLSDDRRKQLESQLEGEVKAGKAGSAASTSGLASVQKKYAADYAKQTVLDVTSLSTSLVNVNASIDAGWVSSLSGSTKDALIAKLKELTGAEFTEVAAAQARLTETSGVAEADLPNASADAIIDALRNVKRLKARLTVAILQRTDLVESYSKKVTELQGERVKAEGALTTGKAAVPPLEAAELKKLEDAVTTAKELETAAIAARDNATANQKAAAASVGVVLDRLVMDMSARRLEAVNKLTTAYGFIGEAATAK